MSLLKLFDVLFFVSYRFFFFLFFFSDCWCEAGHYRRGEAAKDYRNIAMNTQEQESL